MDPIQLSRLKDEHKKGLLLCEQKISQWEKFKMDYETLKLRLETLPDALSYDITVPFGPNAFTMGKLVHSNEVMVLLGDNWFAEVSAKQATDIANRRIIQCSNMLQDLEKEKKQFQNWLSYIGEVSDNENLIEIVEKYDDEEEKQWREQHVEKMKAHRQKLAEERSNLGTENSFEDEVSLQLENLELTETESEPKSPTESNGSTFEYSDDGSQHSEEHTTKLGSLRLRIRSNSDEKSFPESETGDEVEDGKELHSNPEREKSERHVQWQDLSKRNIKKITFKHSKSKHKGSMKRQDPTESEEQSLIQSPSDIYKHFGSFFPSSPPKSILKVKNSPPMEGVFEEPFFPAEVNSSNPKSPNAFTGEVCEHVATIEKKSTRPASHFKNSRRKK